MTRKSLQETLSAVMDNEASELELRRVLNACETDEELKSTWSRYQLARWVMHHEPVIPKLNIASSVAQAINSEAPLGKRRAWPTLARMSLAATVTLAVLAGVRLYNEQHVIEQPYAQNDYAGQVVMPQAKGPAVLASYSSSKNASSLTLTANKTNDIDWHEQRISAYLRQHAQQSPVSAVDSVLPYARAASLEGH